MTYPKMPQPILRTLIGSLAILTMLAYAAAADQASDGATNSAKAVVQSVKPIDFARQVQPILARRCYACHGPDHVEGGLLLTNRDAALSRTDSGEFAIVPGDVAASVLISRITSDDDGERMPPEGDRVTEAEIEVIKQWIAEESPWSKHWAFEPMQPISPPVVDDPAWNHNPIDAFIYKGLADANLLPNPRADRRTLIRRAYYDLLGLPPSPQQVDDFVADTDPTAFEQLVNSLLDSPHYGEKWGRHWLDLVRFAETNSFERDGAKPNAWKFRDYVIRSLNDDKPYGQFVREQLAGDELDVVTSDTLTATGYYRLGIWDDEPADRLQARYDELDDIVTTTGQVFLGLTIDCARCHDHKIDPIPQKDYYSLLAFLADVTPYGQGNQIDVSTDELKHQYTELENRIRTVESAMKAIEQIGIVKMSAPDQRATEGNKRERDKVLDAKLRDHLEPAQWDEYSDLKRQRETFDTQFKALPPRDQVLGLGHCITKPPATFVMFRGNPHSPTDEVGLAYPSLFHSPPPIVPTPEPGARSAGRRRLLAQWITDPTNKLSWRVIANRVWQFHFGRGIVQSSNNFGQLGTPPTHPELLDYLAQRLATEGGKLKSLHRLIMTSNAYQMSSQSRADALATDPGNDLLWRFDPRRLSAEEVRDSILAVNGSLNREVYGPSIYPRLSREVLAGQSQPGSGWGKSSQEQEHRRSVYIHVKRSLLTPILSAFDLPEPDRSCEARFTTLQPGQALALLNGDFVHEQSTRLASSIDAAALDDETIIRKVIRLVLARDATASELAAATELMADLRTQYGLSRQRSIDLFSLTVLNWNEFVFLD